MSLSTKSTTKKYYSTKKIYYTVTGKTDGFGAQYQAILSGIAYCEFMNYQYLHTPILQMEHENDTDKFNIFMGIPKDTISTNVKKEAFSPVVHWSETPDLYYTPEVLGRIRKYYFRTPKPDTDTDVIAIHIRRGDVNKEAFPERYTENNFYCKLIPDLIRKYPNTIIKIFSQGKLEMYELQNVEWHLDTNLTDVFHQMVVAKVLVTAKSSLSYTAALLNQNTVYYMPFWHKPLKKWNVLS